MQKYTKYFGSILSLIVLTTGLYFVFLSTNTNSEIQRTNRESSSKASEQYLAIQRDIKNGAKLIDVRTPEEYSTMHVKDAFLWPLQDIEARRFPSSDKTQKYYVYCRSGNRSAQAKELLENAGYTNVEDLGGINMLEKMNAPMVSGS